MFLQASVSHSVQRGESGHPWSQVPSGRWPGPLQGVCPGEWVGPKEWVGMSRGGGGYVQGRVRYVQRRGGYVHLSRYLPGVGLTEREEVGLPGDGYTRGGPVYQGTDTPEREGWIYQREGQVYQRGYVHGHTHPQPQTWDLGYKPPSTDT